MGGARLEFTFRDANGQELSGPAKPKAATDPVDLLEDAVCGAGIPAIDAVGYRVVHPGRSWTGTSESPIKYSRILSRP